MEQIERARRRCFYAEARKEGEKFVVVILPYLAEEMDLKDRENLEVTIRRTVHPVDNRGFYGGPANPEEIEWPRKTELE